MSLNIVWTSCKFDELQLSQLYEIMQLRSAVFVVEQNCVYQDIDDSDQQAYHICGYSEQKLVCYSRLLPPGFKYPGSSIGRVITHQNYRGDGLGKTLMQKSISCCYKSWPDHNVVISAQQHLEKFYNSLGFCKQSEPYMEDGIPHIEMMLNSEKAGAN
ncbi:MAG: GNAT family N-acetyltransferase [SAR86 cluster bacterium]|uniref:GNAT family N-acetyltransferase n=1 Tax=SAR86 cluster bacterium TaxID=2030880 RepID=A0A2A5AWF6_9GAMM|nr:MAG: GNAT family N-acetyltransferase [SAR86 cluster bacterium]